MVREDPLTPRPVISLTTDFGLADAYAGTLRAVIASRLPDANVIDISHDVPPGAITTAAFLLDSAAPYFPAGTTHLVVVDPGVGSSRARLAIAAGGSFFVGPDNACLSAAFAASVRGSREAGSGYEARLVEVPLDARAVRIENLALIGAHQPSATFEGRDVFAPAAAYLAGRGDIAALGPPVTSVFAFPAFRAIPAVDGGIDGVVIHVDRYGNLITDIAAEDVPPSPLFEVGGREIRGLSHTYAASTGLAAIVGSSNRVEIAVAGGSAAQVLGLGLGDRVLVWSAART